MNIQYYVDQMKCLQKELLNYIDDESGEEYFQNLNKLFNDMNIRKNKDHLKSLLYLISHISNNHYRSNNFFKKIESILKCLKKEIIKHFNETEVFDIFQKNKKVLLFLIQEKIITINQYFATKLMNICKNNRIYFYNEIKDFVTIENVDPNIIKSEEYSKKRSTGLNDQFICQIIRDDSLDEFITFINQNRCSLNSKITPSPYETNPYLIDKNLSFIEYSVFYGSKKIINYLLTNNVKPTQNLFLYAVFSNDIGILIMLEKFKIYIDSNTQMKLLKYSIKCHHIDITNHFLSKFFGNSKYYESNTIKDNFVDYSIHYYNYIFFPSHFDNENFIYSTIKYDHFIIFQLIFKNNSIDISNAIHFAEKESKNDFVDLLSSYSSEKIELKPFKYGNSPMIN